MRLRTGLTTGTCAAAAAKAAAIVLGGGDPPREVHVRLPGGVTVLLPVLYATAGEGFATAAVRKDAGDDPDATHGLEICARVSWSGDEVITFSAGEGVGTVTKPGLQVPPGQPAINPAPRRMIAAAIREVTPRGVHVEVAIPGGREIAAKTFNPRLGIEGGLSILGTTGIVRPYCMQAMHEAIRCALDVAAACGMTTPVLVPGAIGAKAASAMSLAPDQVIEVSNAWGFAIDLIRDYRFRSLLVLGHPGKLAKLAAGQWNTHSARSDSPMHVVAGLFTRLFQRPLPESTTTEGVFQSLPEAERTLLADELARIVREAVVRRLGGEGSTPVTVVLINMAGLPIGRAGESDVHQQSQAVNQAVDDCPGVPSCDSKTISVVGCGPGAPEFLTDAARTAASSAEVLVGSPRLLDLFPEHGGEKLHVDARIESLLDAIDRARQSGRSIAVLVSGDPGLCSLADRVLRRFGRENCRVVPGVSSVQVAFARIGVAWTDARILSAHGRTPQLSAEELSHIDKLAILGGSADAMRWSAAASEPLRETHAVFLCEDLTLPDERLREVTPEALRDSAASSLSIVLVIRRTLL